MFPLLATFAAVILSERSDKRALRKGRDSGPPQGGMRTYWNDQCQKGDRRPWREICADYRTPAQLRAEAAAKVSPAPVESAPLTPAPAPTKAPKKAPPRPSRAVSVGATVAPSDMPGLRLTAPAPRKAPPTVEAETVEAPPYTGCPDHPVTPSGYCTRCADLED